MSATTQAAVPADRWVQAAPFSALLRHLMTVGGVGPADLAALTGLSDQLVRHLAYGRRGRPVRRVSPDVGVVLVQLQPSRIAELRTTYVPSSLARVKLDQLREAGWSAAAAMQAIGASPTEVQAIARLGGSCPELLLLRLRALCRDLETDRELDLELARLSEAA